MLCWYESIQNTAADMHRVVTVTLSNVVWSDKRRVYNQLAALGYIYQMVNHSQNFADPLTGMMCTNHVEAYYWCAVKQLFEQMTGTTLKMVPHTWMSKCGGTI